MPCQKKQHIYSLVCSFKGVIRPSFVTDDTFYSIIELLKCSSDQSFLFFVVKKSTGSKVKTSVPKYHDISIFMAVLWPFKCLLLLQAWCYYLTHLCSRFIGYVKKEKWLVIFSSSRWWKVSGVVLSSVRKKIHKQYLFGDTVAGGFDLLMGLVDSKD